MTLPRRTLPFSAMNPPNSPPRWVRQMHEDEAVWTAFQRRRALRAALSKLPKRLRPPAVDEEISEKLDWLAAEREVGRVVEAHGHWADERQGEERSLPPNPPSRAS